MKPARHINAALAIAVAAAALALAAPSGALAGTVSIGSDHVLHYDGGSSEANHVTLSFDWSHGVYVVKDTGVPSIPGPAATTHCTSFDPQTVYCPFGSFMSISVQLGNGGSYAQDQLSLTPVTLKGGAGNDTLIGGGGPSTLVAGAGNDTMIAGSGDTHFVGGPGASTMTGGPGHDTFQGGSGNETINSRDAVAEQVSCGGGVDTVIADPSDTVAADCENVDRGIAPTGGAGTSPGGVSDGSAGSALPGNLPGAPTGFQPPTATVTPSGAPISLTGSGDVPITLDCPATAVGGCEGTVTLALVGGTVKARIVAARRERQPVIGRSRRFTIAAGRKKVVKVRLSRRGARVFSSRKGHGRTTLRVAATVAMRTEAGVATSSRVITVTAARRRPTPVRKPVIRRKG